MHRRLLLLTRDARLPLTLTILTGLLAGLLTIGQSYALSGTVNDVFLGHQGLEQVRPWLQLLLAAIAGRAILVWINDVASNSVAVRIKTDLRERLFTHILALGPAYARGERTGDLAAAAVEGIEALDAYFSQYLPQLVISTLVPVSILLLVFPLDPLSGVVLLLTAPLIPFFMYMIGRGAEAVTKRQYETLSRLSAHFLDSLQGLTTLKLFGQSKAQAGNIARVSDQYRDTTLKVLQATFLSAFALELLATISTAIIAVEVGLRLLYGRMQFQEALFLLILAPEFYLPLRMLGMRFHAGMAGTTAARRIFQILDTPLPQGSPTAGSSAPLQSPSTIEFSNVSYSYPGEDSSALEDVSFKIAAGKRIALMGASGAGKTTLASLLLRFIEPAQGAILVDGVLLRDIAVEQWRRLVAWVPQNPHLFHDSIAANIRVGRPGATDADVEAAARAAHLSGFIASLPDRYETIIGEAGARLSSGQAQRLALARAFLKDTPVLIMDEPTSSLDPETETHLSESTRELMRGRTVLTIAHRLNTVAGADQIVVLEAGRIVETGTHQELLNHGGPYARIVGMQAGAAFNSDGVQLRRHDATERQDARAYPPLYAAPAEALPTSGTAAPSTLSRLLSFLQGSWGWVGLSVLLGSLTVGSSVALMGTSSWLISTAALHPSIAALDVAIVGVRFFGIARAVFRYLERLVSHNVTFRLLGRLRTWFYEKLEPLAPARLMDYRAGDLLARVISDVNTLENFYVRVVAPPATAILVCIGAAAFLAASDARLAAVLVGSFVVLGVGLPFLVQSASARAGAEVVRQRAELQAQLVDGIQGMPDLLSFGRQSERLLLLRTTGLSYGNAQRRLAVVSGLHSALFSLITNLAPWIMLIIAIPLVASEKLAGVMLAPLVLLTTAAFEAVSPLPVAAQTWTSVRAAAARLFEVVDAVPEVQEAVPAVTAPSSRVSVRSLQFSEVTFSYPGQVLPAVRGVTFEARMGEKLAIVGPSGAGKSTLANLLLRFWDLRDGDICVDGHSIRSIPADEVRARVALISPQTYFFNTTIFENLRMARRGATLQDVERAAKAAQIHDLIVKLPKGYDTLIGEQGLRLSGGERQRLAIARAIIKDAPILILDEPTANLDAENEAAILAALFDLMDGRVSVLITHRLVGLHQFGRILVMEHGSVVEQGSQEELLQQRGLYSRLWENQNRLLLQP